MDIHNPSHQRGLPGGSPKLRRALSSPPEQTVLPTPEVAASRHQGLPALDHEGPGAQELLSGIKFVFQGLESVLGWRLRCLDKGLWRSKLSSTLGASGYWGDRSSPCNRLWPRSRAANAHARHNALKFSELRIQVLITFTSGSTKLGEKGLASSWCGRKKTWGRPQADSHLPPRKPLLTPKKKPQYHMP